MFNGTPPDYDPHRFDARPITPLPAPIKNVRTTPESASRRCWSQKLPPADFPGWEFVTYGAAVRAAESLEAIYTRVGRIEGTTDTIRQWFMSSAVERQAERDAVADGLLRVYKAFRRAESGNLKELAAETVAYAGLRELPLSVRAAKVIWRKAGQEGKPCDPAKTYGELLAVTPDEWLQVKNCGASTLREIREFLREYVGPSEEV